MVTVILTVWVGIDCIGASWVYSYTWGGGGGRRVRACHSIFYT